MLSGDEPSRLPDSATNTAKDYLDAAISFNFGWGCFCLNSTTLIQMTDTQQDKR
jgi:hypothetical protein